MRQRVLLSSFLVAEAPVEVNHSAGDVEVVPLELAHLRLQVALEARDVLVSTLLSVIARELLRQGFLAPLHH